MDLKLTPQLLDHVLVLNETHLRRLIHNYVSYYHADRIHDSLEKDTLAGRVVSGTHGRRRAGADYSREPEESCANRDGRNIALLARSAAINRPI